MYSALTPPLGQPLTLFPFPVQPPMLYIKMCLFKFSLRFRVAPLEIWCTTFRKFEKTCFKSVWSLHCRLVLFGPVDYKTTKSKLLLNVLGVLKISFLINEIDDFFFNYSNIKWNYDWWRNILPTGPTADCYQHLCIL